VSDSIRVSTFSDLRAQWRVFTAATVLVVGVAAFLYTYYRYTFEHAKRLRPIVEGKIYRSGCLTADGFREAIQTLKIKTVINLMEEAPDPDLVTSHLNSRRVKESALCKELGVDLKFLYVEILPDDRYAKEQPATIKKYLEILDDPASYPVLLHCKAGLHRTGVLSAVYRMEYQGWTRQEAMNELKSHGFGPAATTANLYIQQYVTGYQPRQRQVVDNNGRTIPVPGVLVSRPR
jgi:tyrosine-protein phosphatase SIW14